MNFTNVSTIMYKKYIMYPTHSSEKYKHKALTKKKKNQWSRYRYLNDIFHKKFRYEYILYIRVDN